LLVVIAILGILAGLSVPAIRQLGKSNISTSATQQMLDDVGRGRQLAISQRTTVYMVFVPTNFFLLKDVNGQNFWTSLNNLVSVPDRTVALQTATNLIESQLSGYTFIANGRLGDQPGRHDWHYLSTWQSLPEGNFISAPKFAGVSGQAGAYHHIPQWETDNSGQLDFWRNLPPWNQTGVYSFTNILVPFPTEQSPQFLLPCIAFDHQGRLVSETYDGDSFHHAYIPLAQGSVAYAYDGKNKQPKPTPLTSADITESPAGNSTGISYNVIDVDPLTGRARLMFYQIK
jgi:Tfp pilus assembly protein FimT